MSRQAAKTGIFVLTWLNNYATSYYIGYLFFFMREEHGFGNRENLFLAAVNGFVYIFMALLGGKFAQRRGCFSALLVGFAILIAALAVGPFWRTVAGQFVVMIVWTAGTCFTWPALEALVSENETRTNLARNLGIYNMVWASGAAAAYFTGGAVISALGKTSLFWLPVVIHALQIGLVLYLRRQSESPHVESTAETAVLATVEPAVARTFLRLAWLANPFAYIAMNTVIPLVPELAADLDLSKTQAGFVASVWMFARLFSFAACWLWAGWHYRFRWLTGAFGAMIASFALLLLIPNLAVIVLAQLVFGFAVGLIYSSSLFYSMDVGETKGEHGGFHEALIGLGIFIGPAVGAAALQFTTRPNAGIWAVSALLAVGWASLWECARRSGAVLAHKVPHDKAT